MMADLGWKEKQQREYEEYQRIKAFYGDDTGITKFKHPSPGPRPVCAYCGKTYGVPVVSYETKRYAMGAPVEPYRGNGFVLQQWLVASATSGPGDQPGAQMTRDIWDGESYRARSGSDPFCTQTCGVKFAQAAHKAGYRIKGQE